MTKSLINIITRRNYGVDALSLAIVEGADIEERSDVGWTPLTYACWQGSMHAVKLLIEYGADANNYTDKHTALGLACAHYTPEIARFLIESGANVNLIPPHGEPALIVAASNSIEMTDLLIKHGAEIDARSSKGQTALMRALMREENHVIAQRLIDLGAKSIDEKDACGYSTIERLANDGHYSTCCRIAEMGADIEPIKTDHPSLYESLKPIAESLQLKRHLDSRQQRAGESRDEQYSIGL